MPVKPGREVGLYLPKQDGWPDRYGIAGEPVPQGYVGQLAYPFRS